MADDRRAWRLWVVMLWVVALAALVAAAAARTLGWL
jgi:hypothetical protein